MKATLTVPAEIAGKWPRWTHEHVDLLEAYARERGVLLANASRLHENEDRSVTVTGVWNPCFTEDPTWP